MKTQLQTFVLLFSVVISSASAQVHNTYKTSVLPDHPLVKTLKILENRPGQITAFKTSSENFQLIEIENQLWTDEEWLPYLKSENTYQSGQRVEDRGYFIPEPGSDWEMNSKGLYAYESNNLKSYILQVISEGEPITQERTLYSYQQYAGRVFLQLIEYQVWDAPEVEWTNDERSSITLENGIITEVLDEVWIEGEWELDERYFYEEMGADVVETTQIYDDLLEDWVNYEQYIYTDLTFAELYSSLVGFIDFIEDGRLYFTLGLLPDYTSYEWDDVEESWIAIDRQISAVSSTLKNGATTANSILMESQDIDTGDWVPTFEYVLGYADNGDAVNFSLYAADEIMEGEAGQLMFIYSEDYTYDENNRLETILQYGNPFGDFFKQVNDDLSLVGRTLLTWGEVSTSVDPGTGPFTFRLYSAYPNPFNPSTVIPFQMAAASDVKIQVFDMLGRNVATLVDEFRPAGNQTVRFDGSGLSSGVYMIRMVAPGLQHTRSVTLIK